LESLFLHFAVNICTKSGSVKRHHNVDCNHVQHIVKMTMDVLPPELSPLTMNHFVGSAPSSAALLAAHWSASRQSLRGVGNRFFGSETIVDVDEVVAERRCRAVPAKEVVYDQ
jgi:hypothetical protein